ncbi:MAG: hypothetical protein GY857_09725 [Desulfobacula sp.]|nr:hypothetical protein [Desulfobacula sp.]
MKLQIFRFEHSKTQGNRGIQMLDGEFIGFSIECPDQYNLPFISRILPGRYIAKKQKSTRHGYCWFIQDVPNRTAIILNHKGNSARSFSGCVGLGREPHNDFEGERGVTYTASCCKQFLDMTKHLEELEVEIIDC